jgi:hypothetical protein
VVRRLTLRRYTYGKNSESFGDRFEGASQTPPPPPPLPHQQSTRAFMFHNAGAGDHVKGLMQGFGCMFFSDGGHYKGSFDNGTVASQRPPFVNLSSADGDRRRNARQRRPDAGQHRRILRYSPAPSVFHPPSPHPRSCLVVTMFRHVGARGHCRQRCENNHLKLQQMCGAVRKRSVIIDSFCDIGRLARGV